MSEEQKQRSSATSLIKWVLLIVVGFPVAWFAFCEARKAYWDMRVKQMCKEDGGAVVHESLSMSIEEFSALRPIQGTVRIPSIESGGLLDPYVSQRKTTVLREWNPRVVRHHSVFIRQEDKKILGEQVSYSRIGGDFPIGISHHSAFGCADVGIRLDIEKQIFVLKERGE